MLSKILHPDICRQRFYIQIYVVKDFTSQYIAVLVVKDFTSRYFSGIHLVVEGEPGDVDLAGGHEDAGRDVGAQALVSHHHICWVCSVKGLTRAGKIDNF